MRVQGHGLSTTGVWSGDIVGLVLAGRLDRGSAPLAEAAGFLSKAVARDAIGGAIAAVARGEIVLSPDVRASLAGALRERDGQHAPVLTPRERAVLALAAEGRSTGEIAAILSVRSATVKAHLRSIYTKLGVSDRTSAVAAAIRRGLLP